MNALRYTIVPIVEGHGEERAVPVLLRRLIDSSRVQIGTPIRVSPKRFLRNDAEFVKYLTYARKKTDGHGGILILFDLDDGCAAREGPALRSRAEGLVRGTCDVRVVLATREFESWFLYAAPSLAGKRNLRRDIAAPTDPESVRGAKEWLTSWMTDPRRQSYSPIGDQPALAGDGSEPRSEISFLSEARVRYEVPRDGPRETDVKRPPARASEGPSMHSRGGETYIMS
jgi:hypothetical protein